MIGTIGQLLILIAFVASGLAGFSYFRATQHPEDPVDWRRIGDGAWRLVTVMVATAMGLLIYLCVTHQFQYAYVHQYTSRDLPLHFLVSASWAGQEGSFLLWIVLNALVGWALVRWAARAYKDPVMAVVAFCQVFILSMIVGLKIGSFSIGSSPFLTLVDKFPADNLLQANPNFIPADGQGLNDLLQNYWMAIHPPMLFVGFASMIVPFAFAIAALWRKKYTEWVRPALPWTLLAVMFLGVGIAMGGYWAYETLSFGGYWAWDPVENSSLVPWIVGVAAFHMMIIQKKSGSGHKAALFLCILAYMLVIYSTFLTRSGILGDVSVHSFVDLGLYGQLVVWIVAMGLIGFGLFAWRYRELPVPKQEPHYLSREFMVFAGAVLLCAVSAVILLGTSSPILGRVFRDNPATVPISFYNRWTLPLSIGFVFLGGLGQLFWWQKMSVENVNRMLLKPIALSVVSTLVILLFTPFVEGTVTLPGVEAGQEIARQAGFIGGLEAFWPTYGMGLLLLLLLFVAFFSFYGNGLVLWRIARGNPKLAGGAITHIGFAVMVLGIIASSGFSNPLSDASPASDRANFVLSRGETRSIEGYQVSYERQEMNARGRTQYVLTFADERGRSFTAQPVAYRSNRGQWIQHPDVKVYFEKDIFVAVAPSLMFDQNQSGQPGQLTLARGDSVLLGNQAYTLHFDTYNTQVDEALQPEGTEIAVGAMLRVTRLATGETRTLEPVYIIKQDRSVDVVQARVEEWNFAVAFTGMNVDTGEITLLVQGVEIAPEDWVVVQAYEKPVISLVWMGIILLTLGFGLSVYRRMGDVRRSVKRGAVQAV